MENYNEQNFVAFVDQNSLYEVVAEMVRFLHHGESFAAYQAPVNDTKTLGFDAQLSEEDRAEVIKRLALARFMNNNEFTQLAIETP